MKKGKIFVVGSGPGATDLLTARARNALEKSDVVIGYHLYIKQVAGLLDEKKQVVVSSAMGREVERCRQAVKEAGQGMKVALISGGDPGIYGMAGVLLQVALEQDVVPEVEILSGITAATEAAAILGAPLTHDFAVISLSDLLTDWALIEKRLRAAAEADFVIVLYNPRSQGRPDLLSKAITILLEHRSSDNAVGMVKGAGRPGEEVWQATLGSMENLVEKADMATLVVIGNSKTYWQEKRMITPRGYGL